LMRAALLVVVAIIPADAYAEFEEKGVRAGPVVLAATTEDNTQAGVNQVSLVSQPGWMAGAWVTWRKADTFAIQLEAAISNKRLRSEICPMGTCMTTADLSFYFLEVPLVLRLDLLANATKFFLDLGPEAALGLGGGSTPAGGSFERDDDLIGINFGLFGGLGLEIPVGPGKIAFDLRYKRWLVPIKSVDMGPPSSVEDPLRKITPSHQLMLTAGYAFP
jgi:hypothetical protein